MSSGSALTTVTLTDAERTVVIYAMLRDITSRTGELERQARRAAEETTTTSDPESVVATVRDLSSMGETLGRLLDRGA